MSSSIYGIISVVRISFHFLGNIVKLQGNTKLVILYNSVTNHVSPRTRTKIRVPGLLHPKVELVLVLGSQALDRKLFCQLARTRSGVKIICIMTNFFPTTGSVVSISHWVFQRLKLLWSFAVTVKNDSKLGGHTLTPFPLVAIIGVCLPPPRTLEVMSFPCFQRLNKYFKFSTIRLPLICYFGSI